MLCENTENAIQYEASTIRIDLDPEQKRISIFDDGTGIDPEDADALGTAGASKSRQDDGEAPPPANAAFALKKRRADSMHGLRARWGRYGIGRLSRLSVGQDAVARFITKTKASKTILHFSENMAVIRQYQDLRFNSEIAHADDPRGIELAKQVFNAAGSPDQLLPLLSNEPSSSSDTSDRRESFSEKIEKDDVSFTYVEITNVDDGFFQQWRDTKDALVAGMRDKYALHLAGPRGNQARKLFHDWQIINPRDPASLAPCRIIVDGIDLGQDSNESPLFDLLSRAATRPNAGDLKHVDRFEVDMKSLWGKQKCRAEATVATLYFPSEGGVETLPDGGPTVAVFWNGLYLRDEDLRGGPVWTWLDDKSWHKRESKQLSEPEKHFRRDPAARRRLAKRVAYVVFLESAGLFAPELHKRHLRPDDPGFKILCSQETANTKASTDVEQLKRNHLQRCITWAAKYDHDEAYPVSALDDAPLLIGKYLVVRCDKARFASHTYTRGNFVKFNLMEKSVTTAATTSRSRAAASNDFGWGRVRRVYKVQEIDGEPCGESQQMGCVILGSPLVAEFSSQYPKNVDNDVDEAEIEKHLGALLDDCFGSSGLTKRDWWRRSFFACKTRDLESPSRDDEARTQAQKAFPAAVKLLGVNDVEVDKKFQGYAGDEAFNEFANEVYNHTDPPTLRFGVARRDAKTTLLTSGVEVQLQVLKPPGGDDSEDDDDDDATVGESQDQPSAKEQHWKDVKDVRGAPDDQGVVTLAYPASLDRLGPWYVRGRLVNCDLADYLTRCKKSNSGGRRVKDDLDDICHRNKADPKKNKGPVKNKDLAAFAAEEKRPHSRAVEFILAVSEPIKLKVSNSQRSGMTFNLDGVVDAPLRVEFYDSNDGKASGNHSVRPEDYLLRHALSRAWPTVGTAEVELDLTGARLESCASESQDGTSSNTLLLHDVQCPPTLPGEANVLVMPCNATVHLQLVPKLLADDRDAYTLTPYIVKPTEKDMEFVYECAEKPFKTLKELAAFDKFAWIVPRTVAGCKCSLNVEPTDLKWWEDDDPFRDPIKPYEWVICRFKLVADGAHAQGDEVIVNPDPKKHALDAKIAKEGTSTPITLEVDRGQEIKDGVLIQRIRFFGKYDATAKLQITLAGCDLEAIVATVRRRIRLEFCPVGSEQPPSEETQPEDDDDDMLPWVPIDDGGGICLTLDELTDDATAPRIRATIEDDNGDVDVDLNCTVQLRLSGDEDKSRKLAKMPGLQQGSSAVSLAMLGKNATVLAARKATIFVCARDQKDNILLESPRVDIGLKTGKPAALEVVTPNNKTPQLRVGDVAGPGFFKVSLHDAGGLLCDGFSQSQDDLSVRVSLETVDDRGVLEGAPLNARLLPGGAVPGGWCVKRTFSPSDADSKHFQTKIRVKVSGDDDISFTKDVDVDLSPGRIVEIRAATSSYVVVEGDKRVVKGVLCEPLEHPLVWTLHDICGNAAGPEDDGKSFTMAFNRPEDHDGLDLVSRVAREEKKKKKKKRKAPDLPGLSVTSEAKYNETQVEPVQLDGGRLEFPDLAFVMNDDTLLTAPIDVTVRPQLSDDDDDGFFIDDVDKRRCDDVVIRVEPSKRPTKLIISRRSPNDDDYIPTTTTTEDDDDWGSAIITEDDVLQVASGTSVLDVLSFRAYDVAGRRVDAGVVATTRYRIGHGNVFMLATLGESMKTQWFLQSGAASPVDLTFRCGDARASIKVVRVAGPPRAIKIHEEHASMMMMDTDDEETTTVTVAVRVFDGDDANALLCSDGVVRVDAELERDLFGEGAERTATHVERIGIFMTVGGEAYRVDVVGGKDVPIAGQTLLTFRGADLTNNKVPLDKVAGECSLTFRLLAPLEDDEVIEEHHKTHLVVTNDAGRQEREQQAAEQQEEQRAAKVKLEEAKKELRVADKTAKDAMKATTDATAALAKKRTVVEGYFRDSQRFREVEQELETKEAKLEDALRQAQEERQIRLSQQQVPQRAARYGPAEKHERLAQVASEMKRQLGPGYVGFVSELLTVDDDSAATALAFVAGVNRLYVQDHKVLKKARAYLDRFNEQHPTNQIFIEAVNFSQIAKRKLRRPTASEDRAATVALDLVDASMDPNRGHLIAADVFGDSLIFATDDDLDAAEEARDRRQETSMTYRVARTMPYKVYKPQGRAGLGNTSTNAQPRFTFGAKDRTQKTQEEQDDPVLTELRIQVGNLRFERETLDARIADHPGNDEYHGDDVDDVLQLDVDNLDNLKQDAATKQQAVDDLRSKVCQLERALKNLAPSSGSKRHFRDIDPNVLHDGGPGGDKKKSKKSSLPNNNRKNNKKRSLDDSSLEDEDLDD